MSIEDINFLKKQSIRQSYTFLVDSSSRDRRIFPYPSEYSIDFQTPFKYVIGMELLDASIPKTMYNIDENNNKIYFYIIENEETNIIEPVINEKQEYIYDTSLFSMIEIPPGDYTSKTLVEKIRVAFTDYDINILSYSLPIDLTNRIYFQSSKSFILDMKQSTMAEVLGFDLYTVDNEKNASNYSFQNINKLPGCEKLYYSLKQSDGTYKINAPGMMYLLGFKYLILKCPEIEEHLYRSLSYSKYSLGLAKIRINSYGYNDEKTSFMKVPLREFHPIGKLAKLTFRFETNDGKLYDFKGVNHNLTFAIYYYEPRHDNIVTNSILNPEYNPNFIDYMYKQEDIEGDSDEDEEDLSRDNLEVYKKREFEYSNQGLSKKNNQIAYTTMRKNIDNEKQLQYLKSKIETIHEETSEEEISEYSDEENSDDN
jgi:hypothetical protein